jgi:hypothetical protein
MNEFDIKIAATEVRRKALVAELEALTDTADEDPAAMKKWEVVNQQIEQIDRELSRLAIGRRRAKERVDAEATMDAARAENHRIESLKGAMTDCCISAGRLDQHFARGGLLLEDFDAACAKVRRLAQSDAIAGEFGSINQKVALVIIDMLGRVESPFRFERLPPWVTERSVESLLPDIEHVIDFASRHVGSTGKPSSAPAPALAAAE